MQAMYRTVTEGKFSEALRQTNSMLCAIPLTVVDSRREVDDVKELLSIVKCAPLPRTVPAGVMKNLSFIKVKCIFALWLCTCQSP